MASPSRPQGRPAVPAPPGGHALHRDPATSWRSPLAPGRGQPASLLPVHDEVSAGGVVVRFHSGVLEAAVIARRNRFGRLEWCLPKGHLEGKETRVEAAVREVAEETGITGEVLTTLGTIDYWFTGTDRRVHKVVHHYLLRAVAGDLTVEHDPDAEAEAAAWVPLAELARRLSYLNERRVADHAVAAVRDWSLG